MERLYCIERTTDDFLYTGQDADGPRWTDDPHNASAMPHRLAREVLRALRVKGHKVRIQ